MISQLLLFPEMPGRKDTEINKINKSKATDGLVKTEAAGDIDCLTRVTQEAGCGLVTAQKMDLLLNVMQCKNQRLEQQELRRYKQDEHERTNEPVAWSSPLSDKPFTAKPLRTSTRVTAGKVVLSLKSARFRS